MAVVLVLFAEFLFLVWAWVAWERPGSQTPRWRSYSSLSALVMVTLGDLALAAALFGNPATTREETFQILGWADISAAILALSALLLSALGKGKVRILSAIASLGL